MVRDKLLEDKLLEVINGMITVLDPIKLSDFNVDLTASDQVSLLALEERHPEVGIKVKKSTTSVDEVCCSTLTLIATITDILVEKRLAFEVDADETILGVAWWVSPEHL